MVWRGGVSPPNIREKQKRPSEDECEKIPKNQKKTALDEPQTGKSIPLPVQTVGAQGFDGHRQR